MTKTIKELLDEFIEKGADLEHERWSGWQKYLHSLCVKNDDGTLTITKERVERWERQIATNYSELSEQEKEYDRIEVRKYLPLVSGLISQVEALVRRDTIEDILNNVIKTVWEEDETAETIKQIKEYAKTKDIW